MSNNFVKFVQLYNRARAKHHGQKTLTGRLPGKHTAMYKHLRRAFDLAADHNIPIKDWVDAQTESSKFYGHFPYLNQFASETALDRALELRNLRQAKKSGKPIKLLNAGYASRIRAYRNNGVWWDFKNDDFEEDGNWVGTDGGDIKIVVYRLDKLKFHEVDKPVIKKKLRARLKKLWKAGKRF